MSASVRLLALLSAVLILSTATQASAIGVPSKHWVGFYIPGSLKQAGTLQTLQSKIATRASVLNCFQNTTNGFQASQAAQVVSNGSIPLVTLEFWNPADPGASTPALLESISKGRWDGYLRKYARAAKAFGHTVWLRPLHEMNGDWYPWGGTVNGNAPGRFVGAWRHLKGVFDAEGASNVKFVWCPNVESVPNTPGNAIPRYWPGDGYVDLIALDGYNWGPGAYSWSRWQSFSEIFGPAYDIVTTLSNRPVFVAETACTSTTGNEKAAWIANMFQVIPARFPKLTGVLWFNGLSSHGWLLDSSPGSLQAFAAGVTNAGWPLGERAGPSAEPPASPKILTSVTIKASRTRVRRRSPVTFSGVITGGLVGDACRLEVARRGASRWLRCSAPVAYSTTARGARWRYRYTPRVRGVYRFRVRFVGSGRRVGSVSRVVSVSVR